MVFQPCSIRWWKSSCLSSELNQRARSWVSIYNLGSGEARSFNDLIAVLNKALKTNFEPEYIENPHAHYQNFTQADLTRARAALGYEPQFPLEKGVADYMQWLYPAAP